MPRDTIRPAKELGIKMAHQQTIPVPGRLSEAGKCVYEERLKAVLEPDHIGEFVAIEPESGRYFLGGSRLKANKKAREAMPKSFCFLASVAYPAANKIGVRRTKTRMAETCP